jgi:Outer membrane lipoprotein-sorting protein
MRAVALVLLAVLAVSSRAADFNAAPAVSPILDPVKEGNELAAKLRSAVPEESSEFSGVLEITAKDGRQRFIPIVSKITVTSTNWQVVYRSVPTNSMPAETLTILHTPGQSNRYTLAIGAGPATAVPLTHAFAGSDFWLLDLGLEFFHWPQQRALRAEMIRQRPCRVLESVTPRPDPDGYARVLSWIDNETGGVLLAEAYDQHGKLLKKFKLGSFHKVQGQWQLRDMGIRNARTGQRTELKFDLPQKQGH